MADQPPARAGFQPRGVLIAGALGQPLRRATWAGSIASAFLAAVLSFVLGAQGLAGVLVAALLATAAGIAATFVALPTRTRHAFESFAWLGRRELDRIREQTGAPFTGTNPDAAVRWLADNPSSPVTALPRVEVLAMLGRFPEAAAEAARLPPPRDDIEAVGQLLNRSHLRFVAGEPVDDALLAEAGALEARLDPGSEAAMELRVGRAIGEARARLAGGRADWDEPLLAVRPSLGGAPSRVLVRDVWTKLALSMFVIALGIALLYSLLSRVVPV
ncbi:MAG TPA: hypothetical protein VGK16_07455 [Candidatus Limnocylindrales bacterium]